MRKILIILTLICTLAVPTASAQYVRVNIDTKTIAAMSGAFGTESVAETYYKSQIKDILDHYTTAEFRASADGRTYRITITHQRSYEGAGIVDFTIRPDRHTVEKRIRTKRNETVGRFALCNDMIRNLDILLFYLIRLYVHI